MLINALLCFLEKGPKTGIYYLHTKHIKQNNSQLNQNKIATEESVCETFSANKELKNNLALEEVPLIYFHRT